MFPFAFSNNGIASASGGGVATYEAVGRRFVNTDYSNTSTLLSNTMTGGNYQIAHYGLQNYFFVGPRLTYANRLSDQAASAVPITITAKLEYPQGTFHPVTFNSGNTSLTIASGGVDVMSDPVISSVTGLALIIPAGSVTYWEHTFVTGFGAGNGHPVMHSRTTNSSFLDGVSF